MKISPVSSQAMGGVGVEGSAAPSIRSLKLATNVSPDRMEQGLTDQSLSNPATTEQNQEDEASKPLSPQLAFLAKQKRALQAKERELRDRERALSAQVPTQGNAVDLARLKSEPLRVLREAGVTYDQLTEAILANQGNSQIDALEAKIKALEEGLDKKFVERDQQGREQALAEMQREATSLMSQGDTFELVRETRSLPLVMNLIERIYDKSGEILDVQEALQLVEDKLLERNLKIAQLKKLQDKLAPQVPVPQPQQPRHPMRTLTNRDTASVPSSRRARAMSAFYGTLRK